MANANSNNTKQIGATWGVMMESEMEFGEVCQPRREPRERPESNGLWHVHPVFSPEPCDLSIYVDVDVMRELWSHARFDTGVELGGVLLGGQYEDELGRPFVVVSECLRARHFEATKGSFKFTHETWEDITRERTKLGEDLQMVGWYHTHPDWGVFLSGMDLFICDHFFNRPLDVALVLDPCRGEVGFFQWTADPRERTRRTGGFQLFGSRLRQSELEQLALEMEDPAMAERTEKSASSPNFTVQMPTSTSLQGIHVATLVLLASQTCLLLFATLYWVSRDLTRERSPNPVPERVAQADGESRLSPERLVDAKLEVLESMLQHPVDGSAEKLPVRVLRTLAERNAEVETLRGNVRAEQQLVKELDQRYAVLKTELASEVATGNDLRDQVRGLRDELRELSEKQQKRELVATERAGGGAVQPPTGVATWYRRFGDPMGMLTGTVASVLIVVGAAWYSRRRPRGSEGE